ncbi:MAG: spermidine synthase [Beijerinckiaceae bacterium]
MPAGDLTQTYTQKQTASLPHLVITVFAAALFTSASLLFVVQPMFAKLVLPKLGGSPGVWSVATVFFQAVLLCGYSYAHVLTKYLSVRKAALVHIAVMALVIGVALPLGIAQGWDRPPADGPVLWLFGLFFVSIGLPFFAVSANGPLLQAWFARTGHPQAHDPYFLYAASNIGSLLALLAYPLLIEPNFTLPKQLQAWSWTFAFLLALIAMAASFAVRGKTLADAEPETAVAIPGAQKLAWIGLSAVPSGLLVAFTAYISTDIAAAPFLWVIPLALFLLTFIVAFQSKPILSYTFIKAVQPYAFVCAIVLLIIGVNLPTLLSLALGTTSFFILTLCAHHELVQRRPSAQALTQFYFYMSLGGVVGGTLAALVAPLIFNNTHEYPILLFAALFCHPALWQGGRDAILRRIGLGTGALLLLLFGGPILHAMAHPVLVSATMVAVVAAGWMMRQNRQHLLAFTGAVLVMVVLASTTRSGQVVEVARSFFGVHVVRDFANGTFRALAHGTTLHGAERLILDEKSASYGKREPLTYYNPAGAITSAVNLTRAGNSVRHVGVVGLGAGSMACHATGQESWRFFEIDPEVIRLARDPNRFRFVSDCMPQAPIILGDARLTLADEAAAAKDIIVIDAFSSDSIPVHLMTREAVQMYFDKMAAHGVLVMHISNRHLELTSVLTALADELGYTIRVRDDRKFAKDAFKDGNYAARLWMPSIVVAIARNPQPLTAFTPEQGWNEPARTAGVKPWSDNYSDVVSAMIRGMKAH